MSRALTDIVKAYYNMDIENMPSDNAEKPINTYLNNLFLEKKLPN